MENIPRSISRKDDFTKLRIDDIDASEANRNTGVSRMQHLGIITGKKSGILKSL